MARAPGTEVHEKLCEVTECSICAEMFTNPKLLPCVHSFCLHCLEKYGQDKNPGDQMACPLCRNEFAVPQEGLSKLPNNFFIAKIVDIVRLTAVPANEEVCDLCSEETAIAKKFCIDCEQKLCDRCSKSHTKIKHCQNHQVVELGTQLNVKELNFRDSYCEHHPKELIKMFCHNDNVAICLICCVESHQSHRCSNVGKAAGEFAEQLKDDLKRVGDRRPECDEVLLKLENSKTEFAVEGLKTEESIRQSGVKLKKLIDQHTEDLVMNLRAIRDRNLKSIETTKQEVSRFRVMIDSYQRYCDELLDRGSPVDICRDATQMHTRASDLEKQSVGLSCGVDAFCCENISFHSTDFEFLIQQHRSNNVVGEIKVAKASERIVRSQGKFIMVERHVPMDLGYVELITHFMKDELKKIEAGLVECSGGIGPLKGEPGFVIVGNESGVGKAVNDLLKLVENISAYDHDIDRPGIPSYFYSKHGKEVLRGIQVSHKVSIQLDNTQSRAKPQAIAGDGAENCRVEVRPGKFLILMRGDITKCRVDAIVNAANEDLKHYGGVAAAIAEAAGPELEDDCYIHIKMEGRLLPGRACITRAGKLPCKKVIHAVGPRWSGGKADEESTLALAVENSLSVADKEGLKSIAMPSISTGIFGFPLDRATDIIVDAVKNYLVENSSTTVREVFFIDNDLRAVASLDKKLRTIQIEIPNERTEGKRGRRVAERPPQNLQQPLNTRQGSPQNRQPPPNRNQGGTAATQSSGFQSAGSGVIKTADGVRITLVKGSISELQVDVLVNTTGKELNLSHGNVSKSLLAAAGPALQAEVDAKKPSNFDYGQIVVTSGGRNLRCRYVYHGSCRQWDNGKGDCERTVRAFMKNLLERADGDKQKSIAIPAIGTGNLKIPHKIVAEIMYSEVEKFSRQRKPMNLLDIRFIVYDKDRDSVKAFEDKIKELLQGGVSSGAAAATAGSSAPPSQSASSSSASSRPSPSASSVSSSGPDFSFDPTRKVIRIGTLQMILKSGDITKERADAIVNSTNDRMDMTGGAVAKAILKAGGKVVETECRKAKMSSRKVCITSGGNLPVNYIIHLVAGYNAGAWKEVIENALEEAEDKKCKNIVFPMLGTGQIGQSASSMASIMVDAACDFYKTKRPQSLKEITVCIFQSSMLDEFVDAIANKGASTSFINRAAEDRAEATQRTRTIADPRQEIEEQVDDAREPQDLSRIILSIYALSKESIDGVLKDIEEVINEYIIDKVLNSAQDQENIAKLNPEQVRRIMDMKNKYPVQIEVETGRLKRIRIRGPPMAVTSVMEKVHNIFQEAQEKDIRMKEEKWIATVAHWEYEDGSDFENYPDEINAIIEKAFRDNKPYAEWEEEIAKYRLTFRTMVEEFMTDLAKPPIKVRRITKDFDIPANWAAMKNDEDLKIIPLNAGDQEYKDVEKAVLSTAQATVNQIVKIVRIQNKSLYKQYVVRKMTMDAANPGFQNEMTLWHGTSADTLDSINHSGFNRSYCGKNAFVYGRGVYFAKNFNYSAQNTYSPPDATGLKHVYQCKVLTGEYAVGNQNMIVPPPHPGGSMKKYDSTVDNATTPTIFVIFYDTQAFPEYLIYFK